MGWGQPKPKRNKAVHVRVFAGDRKELIVDEVLHTDYSNGFTSELNMHIGGVKVPYGVLHVDVV